MPAPTRNPKEPMSALVARRDDSFAQSTATIVRYMRRTTARISAEARRRSRASRRERQLLIRAEIARRTEARMLTKIKA